MEGNGLMYIGIIVLILFSAFFSGSEIAYASVNKKRLAKAGEAGGNKLLSNLACRIAGDYDNALTSILIGNNLVNIASSSVAAVLAISIAGEVGAAYAAFIMTVIILTFGEILPKVMARAFSYTYTLATAVPLRIFMLVTKPVVFIINHIVRWVSLLWGTGGINGGNGGNNNSLTEDELAAVFEIAGEEGVVDDEKGELLRSTIEFSEISAGEVLTPRVDMTAIDINAKMDEIMRIIDESRHSRLPVYDKNPDDIIGILYLNHFYKLAVGNPSALASPETAVRPVLMEACFIHKNLKLPAVLNEFKRRRIQMAVVVDDYGGTMGIITMEDILEQLVGEIWDETDEIRREFREILPDEYEVDGSMSISDFYRLFDMDEDEEEQFPDYSSVGGWVIGMMNGFPSAGDVFDYKGLYVTVVEMDEHRVKKILVKVTGEEDPEQETKEKGEEQEEESYE